MNVPQLARYGIAPNKNKNLKGEKMADKERPSEMGSRGMAGSERHATGTHDWTVLSQTLVKSPQWTRNTLRGLDSPRPGSDDDHESQEVSVQKELLAFAKNCSGAPRR